jgi:hypothetical protein
MGGPIGVYDAPDYPFLNIEISLLQDRLTARMATLGICLGSQLLARAAGSKVYPGESGLEIGWGPIFLTDAGRRTSLSAFDSDSMVLHWHEHQLIRQFEACLRPRRGVGRGLVPGLECAPDFGSKARRSNRLRSRRAARISLNELRQAGAQQPTTNDLTPRRKTETILVQCTVHFRKLAWRNRSWLSAFRQSSVPALQATGRLARPNKHEDDDQWNLV